MSAEPVPPSSTPTVHDLRLLVDICLATVDNIGRVAGIHIPIAIKLYERAETKFAARFARVEKWLKSPDRAYLERIGPEVEALQRFYSTQDWEILARSLFVALFSSFDAFIGDLIKLLYSIRPELMGKIDRKFTYQDLLTAGSIEALRRDMVADEVDQLRRESYVEQFRLLESRFGIHTLRSFDSWAPFIETAQRRNLVVHCGGRVSEQYLKICREVEYRFEHEPKLGEELLITGRYFKKAVELVYEVALKLSQTLWRKLLPDELEAADANLIDRAYSALERRQWGRAEMIGAFSASLPKHSSEMKARVLAVNHAQALKWRGDEAGASAVLATFDWSCTDDTFQLAVAVLHDNFVRAASLMRRIGKNGVPSRSDYHRWPLFREFRKSKEYESAYAEVFGEDFASASKKMAEDDARELAEEQKRLLEARAQGALGAVKTA